MAQCYALEIQQQTKHSLYHPRVYKPLNQGQCFWIVKIREKNTEATLLQRLVSCATALSFLKIKESHEQF